MLGVVPSIVGVVPSMVGVVPSMVGLVPSMVGVVPGPVVEYHAVCTLSCASHPPSSPSGGLGSLLDAPATAPRPSGPGLLERTHRAGLHGDHQNLERVFGAVHRRPHGSPQAQPQPQPGHRPQPAGVPACVARARVRVVAVGVREQW